MNTPNAVQYDQTASPDGPWKGQLHVWYRYDYWQIARVTGAVQLLLFAAAPISFLIGIYSVNAGVITFLICVLLMSPLLVTACSEVTLVLTPSDFYIKEGRRINRYPLALMGRTSRGVFEIVPHLEWTEHQIETYQEYGQIMFRYGTHGESRIGIPGGNKKPYIEDDFGRLLKWWDEGQQWLIQQGLAQQKLAQPIGTPAADAWPTPPAGVRIRQRPG